MDIVRVCHMPGLLCLRPSNKQSQGVPRVKLPRTLERWSNAVCWLNTAKASPATARTLITLITRLTRINDVIESAFISNWRIFMSCISLNALGSVIDVRELVGDQVWGIGSFQSYRAPIFLFLQPKTVGRPFLGSGW